MPRSLLVFPCPTVALCHRAVHCLMCDVCLGCLREASSTDVLECRQHVIASMLLHANTKSAGAC